MHTAVTVRCSLMFQHIFKLAPIFGFAERLCSVHVLCKYGGNYADKPAVVAVLQVKSIGDIVTLEPAAGATATVLVADLSACKAVIHIIDTILIPKAVSTEWPTLPLCCSTLCIDRRPFSKLTPETLSARCCTCIILYNCDLCITLHLLESSRGLLPPTTCNCVQT